MAERKVLVSPHGFPIWAGAVSLSMKGEGAAFTMKNLMEGGGREDDHRQSGGTGGGIQK